jgi:large subunit ribosomal protein L29
MKQSVVIEMTTPELKERIFEEKKDLARLTMAHAISPLENPLVLREKRRSIARLHTELTKRELQVI